MQVQLQPMALFLLALVLIPLRLILTLQVRESPTGLAAPYERVATHGAAAFVLQAMRVRVLVMASLTGVPLVLAALILDRMQTLLDAVTECWNDEEGGGLAHRPPTTGDWAHSSRHPRRDWARPRHICTGTGLALPHLRRDWAHPCPIHTGTGLTAATSGTWALPRPHLHRDWACMVQGHWKARAH